VEDNRKNFFWTSYVDLMTALFAIVLVLFILSFKQFDDERKKFRVKQNEFRKIEEVKNNLKVLMSDTAFFKYEKDYKRYRLAQNITFKLDQSKSEIGYVETLLRIMTKLKSN
jgi:hypothetical protein